MKFCVFTDIHNNVTALNAVLQTVEAESCDGYLCAGDILGIGPYPEQTVQRIIKLPNLLAVQGNHDQYLTRGMPCFFPNAEGMDYTEMEHHQWEHSQLSESSISFLCHLPLQQDFCICGKKISLLHYCMDGNGKYTNYTAHPAPEQLARIFSGTDADIILYGHDHAPMIHNYRNKWYINSGSLGCPADEKNIARAAILEISPEGSISVRAFTVPYNVKSVTDEIDRLRYPAFEQIRQFFFGLK